MVTDRDGFSQRIPVYATEGKGGIAILTNGTVRGINSLGLTFFAVIGAVGAGTLIYRGIIRAQSRV